MTVDTAGPENSMDKKVRPEPQDVLKLQQAGQYVQSQDELSNRRGSKPSWRGLKCQAEGLESIL